MMVAKSIGWSGVLIRLIAALALVFGTWNPNRWSYYHWAIQPAIDDVARFDAVKFLVGTLLVAGWAVFLQATRRSIGVGGSLLVAAIAGGVIWLLISSRLVTASSGRGIANVILIGLAIVLTVGISWSHVGRSITGQADTDVVE